MVETGSGDDAQLDEELDSLIVVNASKAAVNGEGRVVGGSVSRRFEFPWHVSSERAVAGSLSKVHALQYQYFFR